MNCPACDYRNPSGAAVCVEYGSGLVWTAHREAQSHFKRQLETTVRRAEDRSRRAVRRAERDARPER